MTKALDIIRDEHRRFAAVLFCLESVVADIAERDTIPNLSLLDSIFLYFDSFLDRYHHPKEDEYLFPALQRRYPEAEALLDRLQRQHDEGEALLAELKDRLAAFRAEGMSAFAGFRDAVTRYVRFERDHVGLEERELLPLAERHLTPADWQEIDEAFAGHADPLFGPTRDSMFRTLAGLIAAQAPAPHGPAAPAERRRRREPAG